jgi:hypothetical protein
MDSSHTPDPRRSERPLVELAAVIVHPRSGRKFAAELVELSCEGCRLLTREAMDSGDQLLVTIAGLDNWPARVVWMRGEAVGVEFHQPLQPGVVMRYAETFPPHLRVYTETLRLTVNKPVREVH